MRQIVFLKGCPLRKVFFSSTKVISSSFQIGGMVHRYRSIIPPAGGSVDRYGFAIPPRGGMVNPCGGNVDLRGFMFPPIKSGVSRALSGVVRDENRYKKDPAPFTRLLPVIYLYIVHHHLLFRIGSWFPNDFFCIGVLGMEAGWGCRAEVLGIGRHSSYIKG